MQNESLLVGLVSTSSLSSLSTQFNDFLVRSSAKTVFRVNSLVGRSILLQSVVLARPVVKSSVNHCVRRRSDQLVNRLGLISRVSGRRLGRLGISLRGTVGRRFDSSIRFAILSESVVLFAIQKSEFEIERTMREQ